MNSMRNIGKNTFLVLLVALVVTFCSACSFEKASAEESSNAEVALSNYLDAVESSNADKAIPYMTDGSKSEKELRDFFVQEISNAKLKEFKIKKTEKINDATYEITCFLAAENTEMDQVFQLKNVDGNWKVALDFKGKPSLPSDIETAQPTK